MAFRKYFPSLTEQMGEKYEKDITLGLVIVINNILSHLNLIKNYAIFTWNLKVFDALLSHQGKLFIWLMHHIFFYT